MAKGAVSKAMDYCHFNSKWTTKTVLTWIQCETHTHTQNKRQRHTNTHTEQESKRHTHTHTDWGIHSDRRDETHAWIQSECVGLSSLLPGFHVCHLYSVALNMQMLNRVTPCAPPYHLVNSCFSSISSLSVCLCAFLHTSNRSSALCRGGECQLIHVHNLSRWPIYVCVSVYQSVLAWQQMTSQRYTFVCLFVWGL